MVPDIRLFGLFKFALCWIPKPVVLHLNEEGPTVDTIYSPHSLHEPPSPQLQCWEQDARSKQDHRKKSQPQLCFCGGRGEGQLCFHQHVIGGNKSCLRYSGMGVLPTEETNIRQVCPSINRHSGALQNVALLLRMCSDCSDSCSDRCSDHCICCSDCSD